MLGHRHVGSRLLRAEWAAIWRKWVVPNASLSEVLWDSVTATGALVRHGDATHLEALLSLEVTQPTS
jgi:hypothetical protein